MEDIFKWLAGIGVTPAVIYGLVAVLRAVRGYVERWKAWKVTQPPPVAPEPSEEAEAPEDEESPWSGPGKPQEPATEPPPKHPLELLSETYEQTVRRGPLDLAAKERIWALAIQAGQVKAVEQNKPTIVTLYADGTYKIEDCAWDDVRRWDRTTTERDLASPDKDEHGSKAPFIINDLRDLPINEIIEPGKFLPAHLREKAEKWLKDRNDAIRAGSFYTGDGKTSKDILAYEAHRNDINRQAQLAFEECLVSIRADAAKKAQAMMTKDARRKLIEEEAGQRQCEVAVIEAEFTQLVIDTAVKEANDLYHSNGLVTGRTLTPERIKKLFAF